jgi:hypothetical protein
MEFARKHADKKDVEGNQPARTLTLQAILGEEEPSPNPLIHPHGSLLYTRICQTKKSLLRTINVRFSNPIGAGKPRLFSNDAPPTRNLSNSLD